MFLEKYLSKDLMNYVYDEYDIHFLKTIDEKNFLEIYSFLKSINVSFINDLIKYDLELFLYPKEDIEKEFLKFKNKLGDNYLDMISLNMSYIDRIIDNLNEEE